MGYAKLFSSITESSLWGEPKDVRLLFVTMLARANQIGFVEASVPGLARVANLSFEETGAALEVLLSPDPHSKDLDRHPENEGRRIIKAPGGWVILNYEEYRNRESEEERREYMKQYMRDYRANGGGRKQSVNNCKHPVSSRKESPYACASVVAEGKEEGESRGETGKGERSRKTRMTLEELKAFCVSLGLPETDGQALFDKWEGNGWKNGGKAMRDVEATVRSWKAQGYLASQKLAAGMSRLTGRPAELARQASIHKQESEYGI